MMNFFAHKFARLDGRRFAFGLVFARPSESFMFWQLPHHRDEFSKKCGNTHAIAQVRMTGA